MNQLTLGDGSVFTSVWTSEALLSDDVDDESSEWASASVIGSLVASTLIPDVVAKGKRSDFWPKAYHIVPRGIDARYSFLVCIEFYESEPRFLDQVVFGCRLFVLPCCRVAVWHGHRDAVDGSRHPPHVELFGGVVAFDVRQSRLDPLQA